MTYKVGDIVEMYPDNDEIRLIKSDMEKNCIYCEHQDSLKSPCYSCSCETRQNFKTKEELVFKVGDKVELKYQSGEFSSGQNGIIVKCEPYDYYQISIKGADGSLKQPIFSYLNLKLIERRKNEIRPCGNYHVICSQCNRNCCNKCLYYQTPSLNLCPCGINHKLVLNCQCFKPINMHTEATEFDFYQCLNPDRKLLSVITENNTVTLTFEPKKEKTLADYVKELGYEKGFNSIMKIQGNVLNVINRAMLFQIALTIMNDIGGHYKPDWKNCVFKYTPYWSGNSWQVDGNTLCWSAFYFETERKCQKFIDICGTEFLNKLHSI